MGDRRAAGDVFRDCNWKGEVARRGDLPRSVLDSSGRRDLVLAVLERLRDLLRPLETSSFVPAEVTSRKVFVVSSRGAILPLGDSRLGSEKIESNVGGRIGIRLSLCPMLKGKRHHCSRQ